MGAGLSTQFCGRSTNSQRSRGDSRLRRMLSRALARSNAPTFRPNRYRHRKSAMADNLYRMLSDKQFQQMQATLRGLKSQILMQRSLRLRENADIDSATFRDILNDLNGCRAEAEDGWIQQVEESLADMARHLPSLTGLDAEARQALFEEAEENECFMRSTLDLLEKHPEYTFDEFDPAEWLEATKLYALVRAVAEAGEKADEGLTQLLLRLEFKAM